MISWRDAGAGFSAGYDRFQRPYPATSIEKLSDFLPVAVKLTPATVGAAEPSLSQDCLTALRAYLEAVEERGEEQVEVEEQEEVIGSDRKRLRKAVVDSSDDDQL